MTLNGSAHVAKATPHRYQWTRRKHIQSYTHIDLRLPEISANFSSQNHDFESMNFGEITHEEARTVQLADQDQWVFYAMPEGGYRLIAPWQVIDI